MSVQVTTIQRGSTYKIICSVAMTSYSKNKICNPSVISSTPTNINNLIVADFKFQHFFNGTDKFQLLSASFVKAETNNQPLVPFKLKYKAFSEQLYCTDKSITTQISHACHDTDMQSYYTGTVWIWAVAFEVDIIILNLMPTTPLTNNHKSLYDDTEFTDFDLSTSDGSVPVHKAMLFMHSDMFKLMMRGEWKETSQGRISMDGITVQTLQQLKDYMYLGTLPENEADIETLLQLAAHYFMDKLKTDCIVRLSSSVTPENLDRLIQLACLHNLPDLVRAIMLETPDSVVNRGFQLAINKEQPVTKNASNSGGKIL